MSKKNGYELSRAWFDFAFENPDKVSSNHTALYLWLCEINNRLGWTENFQITVSECMMGMSCKSYNTYKKCLENLIDFGFVKMVKRSVNQHQCNVIALSKIDKAPNKALDKALIKHLTKQSERTIQPTVQSTDDIHKPITNNQETLNLELDIYSFDQFLHDINTATERNYRGDAKSKKQFAARIKEGWTKQQFQSAINHFVKG